VDLYNAYRLRKTSNAIPDNGV